MKSIAKGNDVMAKKKMDLTEATKQMCEVYFTAFQKFMELTGRDIGLSAKLATGYMAAVLTPGKEKEQDEEAMTKLLNGDGFSRLIS